MPRLFYALHRWVSLLAGLQLLLWSIGGLVFATHSMEWVHGDRTRRHAGHESPPLPLERVRLTPGEAARAAGVSDPLGVRLVRVVEAPAYLLEHPGGPTLVDAGSGRVLSPLGREEALAIAREDQREGARVSAVRLLETDAPVEYRERPLPAWVVDFEDGEGTRVYVSARGGQVTARRNDAWRRFDFFWMLHTMDYRGRDDFNHPLLVGFAALGVLSAATGLLLWGLRLSRRWRSRRARLASGTENPAEIPEETPVRSVR